MSANMDKWLAVGEKLGFEGKELREFVFAEQEEREERIAVREDSCARRDQTRS